ncbi:MAG: regulator of protease activity HflC (stomatin/prohibitin superfamily) [Candidatus Paceibacteria bacterium]|jgi:regulator of protease activity HflC (stomatin/prohibitin superfamily)
MNPEEKKKLTTFCVVGVAILLILAPKIAMIALLIGGFYYFSKSKNVVVREPNSNNFMDPANLNNLKRKASRSLSVIVFLVIGVILLLNMVITVPAGQTGVVHLFGDVYDTELSSGIHLINPLASIKLMSIRTEQYTMSVASTEGQRFGDDSIESLTKEGLKVSLDMTVLFRLIEEDASEVYRMLGLDYEEKILRPEVRSAIREVIALYEAKDIYSEKREEAVGKIEDILKESLTPRGIQIESVLLRNVSLPPMLALGIEEKLTAEQEAQKYDFILQKEEKEAERKRIEAAGQRDAQQIINQSLTDRYLQFLYVQNLENREGTIYVPYDMPLLRGI